MERRFGTVILALLLLIGTGLSAFGQAQTAPQSSAYPPPPRGFQDILLGSTFADAKVLIEKSPYFAYKGGPEVSLAPSGDQRIIETAGVTYVAHAIFQFHEGKLYIITIQLNPAQLDWYSMFTDLSKKYGDPTTLSPSQAVWESSQVLFSLEKPLTIKYIDRVVFDQILEAGKAQESLRKLSRDEFINLF